MLSDEEKRYLFRLIRGALSFYFEGKSFSPSPPTPQEKYPHLFEKRGAFVTLWKGKSLRGCIGNIYPARPLYEEICEIALSSALRDPRFPPLQKEELSEIELEISLLSPLIKGSIEDLEVGKHGILIQKGYYRGLLLPQVATEYNWDAETFLRHACLKAGLPEDCYLHPETEIYLFTAEVFKESEILGDKENQ